VTVTPAAAAREFLEVDGPYKELNARREAASKVLREHFRKSKTTKYRGVLYACSTFTGFDIPTARQLLGNKASQAEVTRTRETLSAAA
jgi:hypothetical protein